MDYKKIEEIYGIVKKVYTVPAGNIINEISMIIIPHNTQEAPITCINEDGQFKEGQEVVYVVYQWKRPITEYDRYARFYGEKGPDFITETEDATFDAQKYRNGLCNEDEVVKQKQAYKLLKIEEQNKELQNENLGKTR